MNRIDQIKYALAGATDSVSAIADYASTAKDSLSAAEKEVDQLEREITELKRKREAGEEQEGLEKFFSFLFGDDRGADRRCD